MGPLEVAGVAGWGRKGSAEAEERTEVVGDDVNKTLSPWLVNMSCRGQSKVIPI